MRERVGIEVGRAVMIGRAQTVRVERALVGMIDPGWQCAVIFTLNVQATTVLWIQVSAFGLSSHHTQSPGMSIKVEVSISPRPS